MGSFTAKIINAKNACTRNIYAGNASSIINACIKTSYINNACIGSLGAIKYLGIYLQTSRISEVRLFSNAFGTKLGTNWYKICFWDGCVGGVWVRNAFVRDNYVGNA